MSSEPRYAIVKDRGEVLEVLGTFDSIRETREEAPRIMAEVDTDSALIVELVEVLIAKPQTAVSIERRSLRPRRPRKRPAAEVVEEG